MNALRPGHPLLALLLGLALQLPWLLPPVQAAASAMLHHCHADGAEAPATPRPPEPVPAQQAMPCCAGGQCPAPCTVLPPLPAPPARLTARPLPPVLLLPDGLAPDPALRPPRRLA